MTESNEEKFERLFPKMYTKEQPYGGIAVGAGWIPLIETLSRAIQQHIDWKEEQKNKYNRGSGCTQVVVHQVKEKFGTLRFYVEGGDDYTRGVIDLAESMSAKLCETCGNAGFRREGGWLRTLCDAHEAEYQARKR